MEYRADIIIKLLQYIDVNEVLEDRVNCENVNLGLLRKICYAMDGTKSEASIEKRLEVLRDDLRFEMRREYPRQGYCHGEGISLFDLIDTFVKKVFLYDNNEMVCEYDRLPEWNILRSKIGEELIISAAYAWNDNQLAIERESFLWRKMANHNNNTLNRILGQGMSDNHCHLRASAPYFELSWLVLMNNVDDLTLTNQMDRMDNNRRNPKVQYSRKFQEEKFGVLHIKAALIRIYLYAYLTKQRINFTNREYIASEKWLLDYIMSKEQVISHLVKRRLKDTSSAETFQDYLKECYEEHTEEYLEQHCPRFYWFFFIKYPTISIREIEQENELLSESGMKQIIEVIKKTYPPLRLDDCSKLFRGRDREIFYKEWNKKAYEEVKLLLKKDDLGEYHHLMGRRKGLQKILDTMSNHKNLKQKDYAMGSLQPWKEEEWDRAVIAGERWILYQMLSLRNNGREEEIHRLCQLFYAYLIIKENFRMELLQTNDKIGFENFQSYQARKNWFTTKFTEGELARLAVYSAFHDQVLNSLELRISPCDNAEDNLAMIRRYTAEIEKDLLGGQKRQFYYVFHFGKKKDLEVRDISNMKCRHERYRNQLKRKTRAIINMRKGNQEVAKFLRGIDACSSEDGCRPEVFAIAFRALKRHVIHPERFDSQVPQLRITYHVGEDNQDILDGLRAIDEAIFFLKLDSGDRLGHATALGLPVEKEYERNGYQIAIRQQDYLDNIVWLYHKLLEFRIPDQENLLENLEKEFHECFEEIYLKWMAREQNELIYQTAIEHDREFGYTRNERNRYFDFDIHNYYNFWKLRGDDPKLYQMGFYQKQGRIFSPDLWESECINDAVYDKTRYILEADILYYMYHYNGSSRKAGDKYVNKHISHQMVKGISLVQKAMQRQIARRGIAIETNPTSNIMISSLKNYGEHPILTFYNRHIVIDKEKLGQCPQMNVSINTDDPGVFSTMLHNEYTMMANALESLKDIDGNHIYKKNRIYDWVDAIRKMGNNQSFIAEDLQRKEQGSRLERYHDNMVRRI